MGGFFSQEEEPKDFPNWCMGMTKNMKQMVSYDECNNEMNLDVLRLHDLMKNENLDFSAAMNRFENDQESVHWKGELSRRLSEAMEAQKVSGDRRASKLDRDYALSSGAFSFRGSRHY
tara:strand:- start:593 stop:946 length:354 start_codon:yes stop_codon:yes gene_type:complete